MGEHQGLFFWGFLFVFGAVMYLLAPRASEESGFFRGHVKSRPNETGESRPNAASRR